MNNNSKKNEKDKRPYQKNLKNKYQLHRIKQIRIKNVNEETTILLEVQEINHTHICL